jgi:hypothetical protein
MVQANTRAAMTRAFGRLKMTLDRSRAREEKHK